jgi:hypothetical protein
MMRYVFAVILQVCPFRELWCRVRMRRYNTPEGSLCLGNSALQTRARVIYIICNTNTVCCSARQFLSTSRKCVCLTDVTSGNKKIINIG